LGDDDVAEELVELFVVSDGELKVSRDDSGLFVVPGGVSGELEDLGGEISRREKEERKAKEAKDVNSFFRHVRLWQRRKI
jgi:hypothetical protein